MIISRRQARSVLMAGSTLLLAACTQVDNIGDLQVFVDEVKSRPGAEVEPVPEFVPYEGFIYGAASLRSPFELPVQIDGETGAVLSQNVQPDLERIRELLENQSLSELTMVGMLASNGIYEALVLDGFGEVHRVNIGSHLGRNHGRIQSISQTQLSLIEIVPSGNGGWLERPQTLTMQ
jgi:type IV pilus assembly protein PilP